MNWQTITVIALAGVSVIAQMCVCRAYASLHKLMKGILRRVLKALDDDGMTQEERIEAFKKMYKSQGE